MKKFEITHTQKIVNGITLYQIKALKDFANVKAGDLRGWIEKEDNLSQERNCWVYESGEVYEGGRVFGDAQVFGRVCGDVQVYGKARIFDGIVIFGGAKVYGDSLICSNVAKLN